MIVNCVYIHVKEDKIGMFVEATAENHLESVKEPGNLRFDLIQQSDDKSRFMLYEAYDSEAAELNHKTTAHYLRWRNIVESYMAEPRQGVKYNIVEPNDRNEW
jgi:(4S)-4-hydroxy-5-phosphonooxypentane-2,3-dione isomerase